MTADEAAKLIEAIADSLQKTPNQFSLSVTAVGMQAIGQHGGTGVSIVTTGGGSGSQTTGLRVSASSGDVEIAQAVADKAIGEKTRATVETLRDLAASVRSSQDPGRIRSILDRLKAEFTPMLVVETTTAVLEMAHALS
jgi:hypothetical protein